MCPIVILPHSKKVMCLNPGYNRPFCVALVYSLHVCVELLGSPTIKNNTGKVDPQRSCSSSSGHEISLCHQWCKDE